MPIVNTTVVIADETDPNEENNTASISTNAMPNPTAPPIVKIRTPTNETILTAPANFEVAVLAFNSGGSGFAMISQVELFHNGQSVGTCSDIMSNGSAECSFPFSNISPGEHSLVAVATNQGGRKSVSGSIIFFVNGPATVSLNNPTENLVFGRPENIVLTATAANPSGSVSQIEFTANGELIGNGVLSGTNQYT